jgi:hypothetical protein
VGSPQVEVTVGSDGQVHISGNQDTTSNTSGLTVTDILLDSGQFTMTIFDRSVAAQYNAALSDGSQLPGWLSVDPATGTVTGHPPEGVSQVQIRIIATDADGKVRTLNVTVKFKG